MSRRKYKSPEAVWDEYRFKLIVMVIEAGDLPQPKKAKDASVLVKVRCGPAKYESGKQPCAPGATFNHMSFFDRPGPTIQFEVWMRTALSKKCLGVAVVMNVEQLKPDCVVERVLPLASKEISRKTTAPSGGELRVRLCFSHHAESRAAALVSLGGSNMVGGSGGGGGGGSGGGALAASASGSDMAGGGLSSRSQPSARGTNSGSGAQTAANLKKGSLIAGLKSDAVPDSMIFYYDSYMPAFKTGDILLYSQFGIIASLTKLTSNSNFSAVALVIELPNRWTGRLELFVVEITRNIDKITDSFNDKRQSGVNIFRLEERMHSLNVQKIWWSALKKPVTQAHGDSLREWIQRVRNNEEVWPERSKLQAGEVGMSRLLRQLYVDVKKGAVDVVELFSAEFVARALKLCELLPAEADPRKLSITDVVSLSCFYDPVLIAERGRPHSISVLEVQPSIDFYLVAKHGENAVEPVSVATVELPPFMGSLPPPPPQTAVDFETYAGGHNKGGPPGHQQRLLDYLDQLETVDELEYADGEEEEGAAAAQSP